MMKALCPRPFLGLRRSLERIRACRKFLVCYMPLGRSSSHIHRRYSKSYITTAITVLTGASTAFLQYIVVSVNRVLHQHIHPVQCSPACSPAAHARATQIHSKG